MKIWKSLVFGAILASLLTVTAFASSFTTCAETLSEIGVFKGTGSDFELDRAPTRVEAAVMTVRMLGAEKQAQADFEAGKTSHPFTDVESWADPYIAYLYTNKLTTGEDATHFGNGICTAQQYTTFMLRCLGYSDKDGADFTYVNAVNFGMEIGVVDFLNCSGRDFLRDNVAAMTLTTLAMDVKGQDMTLFEKLVKNGAISKNTEAGKFLDFYSKFVEANGKNNQNNVTVKANLNADVTMVAGADGEETSLILLDGTMDMAMDMDNLEDMKVAMSADMTSKVSPLLQEVEGQLEPVTQMDMELYVTNNGIYQKFMDETVKISLPLGEFLTQMGTLETPNSNPICMFSSGSVVSRGSKDVYTMTFNMEFLQGLLESNGKVDGFAMDDMVMTVTTTNDNMTAMTFQMTAQLQTQYVPVIITMDMDATFSKWGTTQVKLPTDLDTYPEMPMTGIVGIADNIA